MIRVIPALLQIGRLVWFCAISIPAGAQDAQSKSASVTALMRQMTGAWQVSSRMWPGPDAKAIELPPSVARRELIGEAYLQEVMQPVDKAAASAFTRTAYFSFNPTNQQYEYFSLDTRLPQMMTYVVPGANKVRDGKVELTGTSFVAPEWGAKKNVAFVYRLTIGPVESNSQVVQLFLTEQNGEGKEFLAFEYVYRR